MKLWGTDIIAIDPLTGELKTWGGPDIKAPSKKLAEEWCRINCGYLRVIDELVCEIPCKPGTYEPDWDNMIDYEQIENN